MTYLEWSEIFCDNLKSLMEERDISVAELADEIGACRQSVYNYLERRTIPSAVVILNIAYALNCKVDDLMDFGDCVR